MTSLCLGYISENFIILKIQLRPICVQQQILHSAKYLRRVVAYVSAFPGILYLIIERIFDFSEKIERYTLCTPLPK